MTATDKPAFAQAVAQLAVCHREKIDRVVVDVYFDGLKGREIEFVVAAAERLMRANWFPKLAVWHREAVKVEAERSEAQRTLLRTLPGPLCNRCDDTGWHRGADDRVRRCDCAKSRRLELLGRRPPPASGAAGADGGNGAIGRDEAVSLKTMMERRTGRRIVPHVMPKTSHVTGADDKNQYAETDDS